MVEYREIVRVAETITKEVMIQYEEIRVGSECNMWDIQCVQSVAEYEGYDALATLTDDEYTLCIKHYSDLMHFHGLER